jgi:hypothetical protein
MVRGVDCAAECASRKAWQLSQSRVIFSDTFARRQLKHLLNSYRFFSTGALVREGNIFFAHCQWIFAAGRLDDDEKVAQPRVAPRCEKIRSLNLI